MTISINPLGHFCPADDQPPALVDQLNTALSAYSDKDWNYSRISLVSKQLANIDGPYILRIEILDQTTKQGQNDLRSLSDEVKWGDRHSSELGMLEVVSLRLNKALLEVTSDDYWHNKRPVIRIAKKEAVDTQSTAMAIWYQITEVAGEDFDNR
ncbi:MAG TPA: hypothetical protein VMP11_21070 [Verrucomicrobiae bacterium]|nr:hypothetical protein [Verrucomicrobiae bacterium]